MAKKPYKGLTKSRSNTSGRKSVAKREAEKTAERMKERKAVLHTSKRSGKERLAKGVPYKLRRLEAMPVRMLPDTAATKRGRSLRQMIAGTPRLFINNAVDVEAKKVERKKTATGRPVIVGQMVTWDPWRKDRVRRVHDAYIIGLDDDENKPVNRHRKILVQCSCENFVYVWEYANATVGASRLIYSNGERPVFTNPNLAYGLCKHLVALAKIIMEKDA
jgi:hypothetical protein